MQTSKKITLKDLKAECEALWLKTYGSKDTITNRLEKYKEKINVGSNLIDGNVDLSSTDSYELPKDSNSVQNDLIDVPTNNSKDSDEDSDKDSVDDFDDDYYEKEYMDNIIYKIIVEDENELINVPIDDATSFATNSSSSNASYEQIFPI